MTRIMDDAVEKVARALCQIRHGNPDRKVSHPDFPAEHLGVKIWVTMIDEARAAMLATLDAIAEPTREMLNAANQIVPTWDSHVSSAKWHAMINVLRRELAGGG